MALESEFNADMQEMFDDIGCVFEWRGDEYAAVMTSDESLEPLIAGGLLPQNSFTLCCRKSDFAAQPAIGDVIRVLPTGGGAPLFTAKIFRITTSVGDSELQLICGRDK